MKRFENVIILVTGGAAGIGKATATQFLDEGGSVIIWDINELAGKTLVDQWTSEGKMARFAKVNVADYSEVQTGIQSIIDEFGRLDVLVNNAGITMDKSLLKMDTATWQRVIDINLTGVFNCSQIAATFMVKAGKGVILNASSVVGLYGNFGQTN